MRHRIAPHAPSHRIASSLRLGVTPRTRATMTATGSATATASGRDRTMSYDEHGVWHPVHETYDELGLDERYSRPTMLAGAPVDRDDDGLAVLTPAQTDYVARLTRLVQRSYDRRLAIGAPRPTVAPLPVPSDRVCDVLRDLDIASAIPDAIEGTRSAVHTGRTRKGKPTARVQSHGTRHVPVTNSPSGLAGGRDIALSTARGWLATRQPGRGDSVARDGTCLWSRQCPGTHARLYGRRVSSPDTRAAPRTVARTAR